MTKPITFGKLEFNLVSDLDEQNAKPRKDSLFRVLILGDFSGRQNRGIEEIDSIAEKKIHLIDRDNFDDIMEQLDVELRLKIGEGKSPPVVLRFRELDDFHPDQVAQAEVFKVLRETRKELNNPKTFKDIADRISGKMESPIDKPGFTKETQTDLLDQVLNATDSNTGNGQQPVPETGSWDVFIEDLVAPYIVPDNDPRQEELISGVESSMADLMCSILHHPEFQAAESAWRAVHFLIRNIDTDGQLNLYLLDISEHELTSDLMLSEDLQKTGIYHQLVEKPLNTPETDPFALLAGVYSFGKTTENANLLCRIAKIAKGAGAPFIAGAGPSILGCDSLLETPEPDNWNIQLEKEAVDSWESMRKLPESIWTGLALPGFLLRLPYGEESDQTDYFEFEEMADPPAHGHYLWANPCFACVYSICKAFNQKGWDLRTGELPTLEGMPLHIYRDQGVSVTKPCAEVYLTENAVESMLDQGLMVLVCYRDQDIVKLVRLQSIANPLVGLAGRW